MTPLETEYIEFLDAHLPKRSLTAATLKLYEEMGELHHATHRKGSDEIEGEMADVAFCMLNLLVLFRRLNLPCSGSLDAAMRAKLDQLKSRAAQGVWPKPNDVGTAAYHNAVQDLGAENDLCPQCHEGRLFAPPAGALGLRCPRCGYASKGGQG